MPTGGLIAGAGNSIGDPPPRPWGSRKSVPQGLAHRRIADGSPWRLRRRKTPCQLRSHLSMRPKGRVDVDLDLLCGVEFRRPDEEQRRKLSRSLELLLASSPSRPRERAPTLFGAMATGRLDQSRGERTAKDRHDRVPHARCDLQSADAMGARALHLRCSCRRMSVAFRNSLSLRPSSRRKLRHREVAWRMRFHGSSRNLPI